MHAYPHSSAPSSSCAIDSIPPAVLSACSPPSSQSRRVVFPFFPIPKPPSFPIPLFSTKSITYILGVSPFLFPLVVPWVGWTAWNWDENGGRQAVFSYSSPFTSLKAFLFLYFVSSRSYASSVSLLSFFPRLSIAWVNSVE